MDEESKQIQSEVIRQGQDIVLKIDYEKSPSVPSIEDNPTCMAITMEKLTASPNVTKIIFSQKRDYEYDYNQTKILTEIGQLFNYLIKQKQLFSYQALGGNQQEKFAKEKLTKLQDLLFKHIKKDPVGCYVEIKRILRHEKINLQKALDENYAHFLEHYINILSHILNLLDNTRLIALSKPYLDGYKIGDRDVYRKIFSPTIKPDFMFTKLMASYPDDAVEIDSYTVEGTEVTVFKYSNSVLSLYHITPPEFKLDEDEYEILDMARNIMAEHKPKKSEFTEPARMREVFFNIGRDLIEELCNYRALQMDREKIDELTHILVRYTVGFGLVEVLLKDEKIQDISINSPMGNIPIYIVHSDYNDCKTNIFPTKPEAESWAGKLRMISGRPLDEANPILDTEIEMPGANARVSVITEPLNPSGTGFSFRRHRDKPWTLPLFIKHKMVTPMAAGLLSFLVDGTRTMMIAGTRSSGKSSFLSSILVEIMRRKRIITVEDTLELPTAPLRKLGFNIQPMKVSSAFAHSTSEVSASDGIRATLRLGDSSLIIGEVRSKEAVALYEAMRVGAAANVVAGTIHADSPYGLFDRVVNDIGVPKTSFKATDIIIVANPVKSADGINTFRRVISITEVRKFWEEDPVAEGGFMDLMKYDAEKDQLVVTNELINGESEVLKAIASNIKEMAGNWDAVWDNIVLRGDIKKALVDEAEKAGDMELLEAPFVIKCNDMFHNIIEKVKDEKGFMDYDTIRFEWLEWVRKEIKLEQKRKKSSS